MLQLGSWVPCLCVAISAVLAPDDPDQAEIQTPRDRSGYGVLDALFSF